VSDLSDISDRIEAHLASIKVSNARIQANLDGTPFPFPRLAYCDGVPVEPRKPVDAEAGLLPAVIIPFPGAGSARPIRRPLTRSW
jgi:hypothetical protein